MDLTEISYLNVDNLLVLVGAPSTSSALEPPGDLSNGWNVISFVIRFFTELFLFSSVLCEDYPLDGDGVLATRPSKVSFDTLSYPTITFLSLN